MHLVLHTFCTVCCCDSVCISPIYCSLLIWYCLNCTLLVLFLMWCSLYFTRFVLSVKVLQFPFHTFSRLLIWCSLYCSHLVLSLDMKQFVLHILSAVRRCDSFCISHFCAVCWCCYCWVIFNSLDISVYVIQCVDLWYLQGLSITEGNPWFGSRFEILTASS